MCEMYSLSCDRVKLSKIVCHTTKLCELRGLMYGDNLNTIRTYNSVRYIHNIT